MDRAFQMVQRKAGPVSLVPDRCGEQCVLVEAAKRES